MIRQLNHFDLSEAQFIKDCRTCPDDETLIHSLWQLLRPQLFWRDGRITERTTQGLMIDDVLFIDSAYVSAGLTQCDRVTVMAATVGHVLTDDIRDSGASGALYRASVADLVGSYGVEQLADRFCTYLQRLSMPRGLYQTLRYSPGYGDWPLHAQPSVMAYLDHCNGVITLTEDHFMQPEKSITALVGWANTWQKPVYPEGERKRGFCGGGHNCAACTTWACRKN